MTPGRLVASNAVLSAASTASNPELQKMVFAVNARARDLPLVQRSKVMRLSSRASCAFSVRMNISHRVQQRCHLARACPERRADSRGPPQRRRTPPSDRDTSRRRRPTHELPAHAARQSATNRRIQRKSRCAIRIRARA